MDFFLPALITLLVVIDPIGSAAVAASLTGHLDRAQARRIAFKAIGVSSCLYLFFGLAGLAILHHVGISLSAFRIAGGMLLFVTGFRMLFGNHDHAALTSRDTVYKDSSVVAVFPLSIPLIAGPGCMTALMLLKGRALDEGHDVWLVWAAVGAAMAITLVCLLLAQVLTRLLGRGILQIVIRVMGLLLSAMAVQFTVDGLTELLRHAG